MLESKTVTNGPIAIRLQSVCHDTLPWLISISLDGFPKTASAYGRGPDEKRGLRAHINQKQVSHRDWWNQGHWQGHRWGLRPTRRPGLCAWTERTGRSRDGGGPARPRQHRNFLSRRRQAAGGYGRGHGDGSRRIWRGRHSLCKRWHFPTSKVGGDERERLGRRVWDQPQGYAVQHQSRPAPLKEKCGGPHRAHVVHHGSPHGLPWLVALWGNQSRDVGIHAHCRHRAGTIQDHY